MKKTAKIIQLFKLAPVAEFNPMSDMTDEYLQDRVLDLKTPIEFKKAFAAELKRRRNAVNPIGHRA